MASENETVAEIVKELRDEPLAENGAKPWLHYLADRFEAAYQREVAELRECLKEAVESYCSGCNDFVDGKQKCEPCECKARKWRKALEGGMKDEGK